MAEYFNTPDLRERPAPPYDEDDPSMPIIALAVEEMRAITDDLASGETDVNTWYDQMLAAIVSYHLAAFMAGADVTEISSMHMDMLADVVANQELYLDGFRDALAAEPEGSALSDAYRHRADQYAWATGASYSRGETVDWDLPAYPKDGQTDCRVFCCCRWTIDLYDEDNGNVNATWKLGPCNHCDQCPQRAIDWSPLRIRNGRWDVRQLNSSQFRGGVVPTQ